MEIFRVLRDGKVKAEFRTHNECFTYLLRHQGQSVDYALTHGGWAIDAVEVESDPATAFDKMGAYYEGGPK